MTKLKIILSPDSGLVSQEAARAFGCKEVFLAKYAYLNWLEERYQLDAALTEEDDKAEARKIIEKLIEHNEMFKAKLEAMLNE